VKERHGPASGHPKPMKHADLTQIEPDHVDGSSGPPVTRARERITLHIESHVIAPAAALVGVASFFYFVLGMGSMAAVATSTVIVILLSQPTRYASKHATKLLKQVKRIIGDWK
jgi:hypothetical protein